MTHQQNSEEVTKADELNNDANLADQEETPKGKLTGSDNEKISLKATAPSMHHESVSVVPDPIDSEMVIIRTRKRIRKKKKQEKKISRKLRVIIIVLTVILGLAIAAGIALAIAINSGNANLHKVFGGLDNTPEQMTVSNVGQTVEYEGHTYRYNENIVSFLVIGRDKETYNLERPDATCADANVLFTLDTSNNKMRATIIPRNSWVTIDIFDANGNFVGTRETQLALSHAVLLHTVSECAENTTKAVSRLFYNLPITYYIDINQEVVKEASQVVGGVSVEVLETIPGQPFSQGEEVLLSGEAAYQYVRYRNIDVFESALGRQERQVQFIKSFASKLSSMGIQGVLNLYNSVSDEIVTNVGISEIAYLVSCFFTGNNANLEISSLAGVTEIAQDSNGLELERYYLDEKSVVENMLNAFYTRVD